MRDLTRRSLLSAGAGLLLSAGLSAPALAKAGPAIALPSDVTSGEPSTVKAVRTNSPVVALTFDDGPHPRLTPPLLDLLKAKGIRATFYVIGQNVKRYPGLVRRMVEEGHEVGNHTWKHPFLTRLGPERVLRELDATSIEIFHATGKIPVTMRPPYGAMHARQRAMVHETRNLPTILWSVDTQDWKRPGASVVSRRIVQRAGKGGIVLAHDIHPGTIRAMPAAIDGLAARGFGFVTVSQLLGWPDWSERRFRLAG